MSIRRISDEEKEERDLKPGMVDTTYRQPVVTDPLNDEKGDTSIGSNLWTAKQEKPVGIVGKGIRMAGGFAKEMYKGVARPLMTPFAGFASGVLGRDVQLGGWAGNARGSIDLDKQSRIAGGAALEAASLIPAGRGLKALQAAKPLKAMSRAELLALAKAEASYGAKTGFAGGAGSELGTTDDATLESTLEAGVLGAAIGGPLGAISPLAVGPARALYGKGKSLFEAADNIVTRAGFRKPRIKIPPPDGGAPPGAGGVSPSIEEPKAVEPLHKLSDDAGEVFPEPAPSAKPLSEETRKKAVQLGFREWHPTLISEMSQEERLAARQMRDMAEAKSKNILRPSPETVAAKPFLDQITHLQKVRTESGAALDGLVDRMPNTPLSLEQPTRGLEGWFDSKGIKLKLDEQGKPVGLDFRNSKFRGSAGKRDREVLEEVSRELFPSRAKGAVSFRTPKEIRTMRQSLRLLLEKQTKATDPFSGEVETLISSLRQELNEPLTALSHEYATANQNYAISNDALEDFQKFLGRDFFDASEDEVQKRISEILPRLLGNASAKPGTMIKNLTEAAKKTGMPIEGMITDPRRLLHLATWLDDLYDIQAPRGLGGTVQRAEEAAIEKLGAGAQIASGVARHDPLGVLKGVTRIFRKDLNTEQKALLKKMLEEGMEPPAAVSSNIIPPPGPAGSGGIAIPDKNAIRLKHGKEPTPISDAVDIYRRNSDYGLLEESLSAFPKEASKIAEQSKKFLKNRGITKLYRVGDEDGISYSYTKAGVRNFGTPDMMKEIPITKEIEDRIIAVQGITGDGSINSNETEVIVKPKVSKKLPSKSDFSQKPPAKTTKKQPHQKKNNSQKETN